MTTGSTMRKDCHQERSESALRDTPDLSSRSHVAVGSRGQEILSLGAARVRNPSFSTSSVIIRDAQTALSECNGRGSHRYSAKTPSNVTPTPGACQHPGKRKYREFLMHKLPRTTLLQNSRDAAGRPQMASVHVADDVPRTVLWTTCPPPLCVQ